jgi:hypothetical protein
VINSNNENTCDLIFELPISLGQSGQSALFSLKHKAECFKNVAIFKGDEKICTKIGERYEDIYINDRFKCPGSCHMIKIACYVDVAHKRNDPDVCIEGEEQGYIYADIEWCRNQFK